MKLPVATLTNSRGGQLVLNPLHVVSLFDPTLAAADPANPGGLPTTAKTAILVTGGLVYYVDEDHDAVIGAFTGAFERVDD